MKKNLLYSLALCLFLFSCKKEQEQPIKDLSQTGKKYEVNFGVSGFKETVEGFSSKSSDKIMAISPTDSLASKFAEITYFIYNSEGKEFHRFSQNKNRTYKFDKDHLDSDGYPEPQNYWGKLGSLTDSLTAGTYTLVVVGRPLDPNPSSLNFNYYRLEGSIYVFKPLQEAYFTHYGGLDRLPSTEDVFFKKISFTVGSQDIHQNIVLERVVGKLEINIEDAIPANAKKLLVDVSNVKTDFEFDTEMPYDFSPGVVDTIGNGSLLDEDFISMAALFTDADKGKINFKLSKIFLEADPVKVVIECYDVEEKLIGRVSLLTKISKNKKTVLTGKLFSKSSSTQAFEVEADTEWDSDSTIVTF